MYVAPEALSGELVGPAADQYSLATIAYFLLTGALPFTGKSPRELFSQLLTQSPVSLNKAKPNLAFPVAVENVVMKALSKQPGDRYPSVKDFSDAFAAAAQTTAMASTGSQTNDAAGAMSDGEDKSGLFGKMKGLFRRN
jgi:serine/threonine-protein kinase